MLTFRSLGGRSILRLIIQRWVWLVVKKAVEYRRVR